MKIEIEIDDDTMLEYKCPHCEKDIKTQIVDGLSYLNEVLYIEECPECNQYFHMSLLFEPYPSSSKYKYDE